ncbi:MAG: calcium/sodium antiporter [Bacteriovoracaceae bacterium]|nr:calcium/sodium antiporter [Bacteriovoracaceae bacterium]
MSTMILLYLIGGLVALVGGGELLIRGASKIAAAMGVSSLVIGLTIVAFGTSSPELVVSLKASLTGQADLAVANVVGSNIFNILFILGACAAFAPLVVSSQLVRLDVPIMIGSALLMILFSLNGNISLWEGAALFSILVIYTIFLIYKSRKDSKESNSEQKEVVKMTPKVIVTNLVFIAIGLGLLILGGDWFVTAATEIAKSLGVSDTVIGLTIVAIGTSLPEVATSFLATIKGERDIAIGNVVGSNIYNVFAILGLSSMLTPSGLNVANDLLTFDLPLMLGTAVACLPIFIVGFRINRWEGYMFLGTYVLYTIYLILNATEHAYFENYKSGVIYLVGPILLLTLSIISFQAIKQIRNFRAQ